MATYKTHTFLKSPLFSFIASALLGYFVLYKVLVVMVCLHMSAREGREDKPFLSQNKQFQLHKEQSLLDQKQARIVLHKDNNPTDFVGKDYREKGNQQEITTTSNMNSESEKKEQLDNIKSITIKLQKPYLTQENQLLHPHQNLNSNIKIACFMYPTKLKSAQISNKTWLPLCDGGKVLDTKEFKRGQTNDQMKKDEKDKISMFKILLSSYIAPPNEESTSETTKPSIIYDYFLFTEASSYILVSNLLEYLKNEDDSNAKAYGHSVPKTTTDSYLSWSVQGTLVMNRKAVQTVLKSQESGGNGGNILKGNEVDGSETAGKTKSSKEERACDFGRYIPNTPQLLECLLEMGGHLIDSRDHASKTTFFHNFNPFYILSDQLPTAYKLKELSSTSYCQDKSCMSAFPVALHDLNASELQPTHFLVTWCRYALFLGNFDDPLVRQQGLQFNGTILSDTKLKKYDLLKTTMTD